MKTIEFYVEDGEVKSKEGETKSQDIKIVGTLTLNLSFVDPYGKVFTSVDANATWTLNNDVAFEQEWMKEEVEKIFKDQLIIDLNKGLMKKLVEKMFNICKKEGIPDDYSTRQ